MQGFRSAMLGDLEDGLGVVVLANGPSAPGGIAEFALKAVEAAYHQQPLPDLPDVEEPTKVPNATDYAGTYTSTNGSALTFRAVGDRLELNHKGQAVALERRGTDTFYCRHPEFALFLVRFVREKGAITEMSFGPQWYANERYTGTSHVRISSRMGCIPRSLPRSHAATHQLPRHRA